ncbi:MAG: HD domain-containing protein [Bacteroidaceae bacterium]|nr:HD domain-containing protein [Bacteroidaceae bacterium]
MHLVDAIKEYDDFRQRTRQTDPLRLIDTPLLRRIGEKADELGLECYVVGGYVRDIILERPSKDIDVVVASPPAPLRGEGSFAAESLHPRGEVGGRLGPGILLAQALAKDMGRGAHVSVFRNFGTAQLKWHGQEIEFVGARRESYQRDSRKPIVEDGTLDDDLHRRDFTINALAVCLNREHYGKLIDLFDGLLDLEDGIIATPLDPDITFSDDPLRMMRCIRFATQLRFQIEDKTQEALRRNAERIKIISQERIIDELNKIMMAPAPSIGFIELSRSGLLPLILPEIAALEGVETRNGRAHKDNFYHTLEVLDNISKASPLPAPPLGECPNLAEQESMSGNEALPQRGNGEGASLFLRWAALLHDVGKPRSKRWDNQAGWTFHNHNYIGQKMVAPLFRRMKLPTDERMAYVEKLVGLHMRPIAIADDVVTDSAVRRLLFEAGEDIDDLMRLCEADITSKNREKKRRFLENFQLVREKLADLQARDNYRTWHNPITGEEIMQTFGLKPCRQIGILKQAVKDAIWDSVIPNDHAAAFQFMLNKAKEMGLEPTTPAQT